MEINVTKNLGEASIKDIEDFEKREGLIIPKQLKDFWVRFNPIYTKQNVYQKSGQKYFLDRFYPFLSEYELSFQAVFPNLVDYLGREYLSFANDPGDWQFLISIKDNFNGEIYLCRMDEIIPNSLIKIADSFEEFINGLKSEDEII